MHQQGIAAAAEASIKLVARHVKQFVCTAGPVVLGNKNESICSGYIPIPKEHGIFLYQRIGRREMLGKRRVIDNLLNRRISRADREA